MRQGRRGAATPPHQRELRPAPLSRLRGLLKDVAEFATDGVDRNTHWQFVREANPSKSTYCRDRRQSAACRIVRAAARSKAHLAFIASPGAAASHDEGHEIAVAAMRQALMPCRPGIWNRCP